MGKEFNVAPTELWGPLALGHETVSPLSTNFANINSIYLKKRELWSLDASG